MCWVSLGRFLCLSLTKIAKFDLAYSSIWLLEMTLGVISGFLGLSEAALDTALDGGTGPGRATALTSSDNLNWNCFSRT